VRDTSRTYHPNLFHSDMPTIDMSMQSHDRDPAADIKPRLLFFQYRYDQSLPEFLLAQKNEHVKCLGESFEVTVINYDCDYRTVCAAIRPHLTLVEGGVSYQACRKLRVINTDAYPEIPKLGLMNSDSFCRTRSGFISDMEHWGIDTAFAIATTAEEYTPDIVEHLYTWPVFIDDDVCRDYGESKNIPILFTGSASSLYPWRQRMMRVLPKVYPSLMSPHPGYAPRSRRRSDGIPIIAGERYARMLNSSVFVPACGTVVKDAVRKHFEVPGCRACLVTERSAVLEAAGFRDMENCVFADREEVVDKLDYLFATQDKLEAITNSGYKLVHSRHTLKQRNQIRQWFDLWRQRAPGQQIIQPGPFEPLEMSGSALLSQRRHPSENAHLKLLREGDENLKNRNYDEALRLYTRCWNYIPWMPEPQVGIARCKLYRGQAGEALRWLAEPLGFSLTRYEAEEPDPVEWSLFLGILLCQGKVREAKERALQFRSLRHVELDRMRSVIRLICGSESELVDTEAKRRGSIHTVPMRTDEEWLDDVRRMLSACGQGRLGERLTGVVPAGSRRSRPASGLTQDRAAERTAVGFAGTSRKQDPLLHQRDLSSRMRRSCRSAGRKLLHKLEQRIGYFLPYEISAARHDEFYGLVEELAGCEEISSALMIGANQRNYLTAAFVHGLHHNKREVNVECLGASEGHEKGKRNRASIESHSTQGQSWTVMSQEKCFDLVIADLREISNCCASINDLDSILHQAKTIVLYGTDFLSKCEGFDASVKMRCKSLSIHNCSHGHGYAVYEQARTACDSSCAEMDLKPYREVNTL
jgi:glycosyl transferase family 1